MSALRRDAVPPDVGAADRQVARGSGRGRPSRWLMEVEGYREWTTADGPRVGAMPPHKVSPGAETDKRPGL